jgi:hypothetical protein
MLSLPLSVNPVFSISDAIRGITADEPQGSWNCVALLSRYDLATASGVAIDPGQRALVSLMPDLAKF